MTRPAPAAAPIEYPSADGQPMAENDAQRSAIMYGISALSRHFKNRRDVYVSGDLLIYYGRAIRGCRSLRTSSWCSA